MFSGLREENSLCGGKERGKGLLLLCGGKRIEGTVTVLRKRRRVTVREEEEEEVTVEEAGQRKSYGGQRENRKGFSSLPGKGM